MRLADFILRDMERILASWETFASTRLPAAGPMSALELRDHAQQILEAIANDLRTSQTREQQAAKSKGLAPTPFPAVETAAQTHAVLRASSGFNIRQLASEFRALRASVLQSWFDDCRADEPLLEDVVRFNEAIDQALAESIAFYSAQVDRSRNLLLGMLGHDMRSPLQAIKMTAHYLSALNAGAEVSQAASRLINSGSRMQALLDDLLDFNRTQLGLGIRVAPDAVDLAQLCHDEVEEIRAVHSGRIVELQTIGDCRGSWDYGRLRQLLGNLIGNAVKYGDSHAVVHVTARGVEDSVRIEVRNSGSLIPADALTTFFEPLKRAATAEVSPQDTSLGLGLFIAREIAKAHGGEIEARSDATRTVFSVYLPRQTPT